MSRETSLFDAYWSDPHFGHAKVIEYSKRPFNSVEEMNETLIQRYNEIVGPKDTCLCVGDMFFGPFEAAEEVMSRLNGRKVLVLGNHDRTATRMSKTGFLLVTDLMTLNIDNHVVRVSHYPYAGMKSHEPTEPDREVTAVGWRRNGKQEMLMHGHTHSTKKRDGMAIHVGVDAWDYRPATHDQIVELVREANSR